MTQSSAVSFDEWTFHRESGELEKEGVRVRLQDLPLQILNELLVRPGEMVTREHLIAKLWPTGVIDFDTSLNSAVRKLRAALDDDADSPRYIETVPRRGYRFIGKIAEAGPTAAGTPAVRQSGEAHAGHQEGSHHKGLWVAVVFGTVALFAVAVAIGVRFFGMGHSGAGHVTEATGPAVTPAFNPPAHSIAVLPFVNMSGDPQQEYFSDGLAEELLNSLVRINSLHVAARTSSFSFKGQKDSIAEIAQKLNVRTVLEGSVRKDGGRVRITAQLIDADTGFHVWSGTYDRDLKDLLKLQTEIATAVTTSMNATLLGTEAELIDLGGTTNPEAFDAFLRDEASLHQFASERERILARVASLTEAIRLDPNYAKAYSRRSFWMGELAAQSLQPSAMRRHFAEARADAEKAIALAPFLADGHLALSRALLFGYLDFQGAAAAAQRAAELTPGDAEVQARHSILLSAFGHFEDGVAAARRATVLDPLTPRRYRRLAQSLISARRFPEAVDVIKRGLSLDAKMPGGLGMVCHVQYAMGQLEAARQTCAKNEEADHYSRYLLVIILHKLNRKTEAEAALARLVAADGDPGHFNYATIYAQWGDIPKALDAIEAAFREKEPGLAWIKEDFLLDPLREEPRFKAVVAKLNFPP